MNVVKKKKRGGDRRVEGKGEGEGELWNESRR